MENEQLGRSFFQAKKENERIGVPKRGRTRTRGYAPKSELLKFAHADALGVEWKIVRRHTLFTNKPASAHARVWALKPDSREAAPDA